MLRRQSWWGNNDQARRFVATYFPSNEGPVHYSISNGIRRSMRLQWVPRSIMDTVGIIDPRQQGVVAKRAHAVGRWASEVPFHDVRPGELTGTRNG